MCSLGAGMLEIRKFSFETNDKAKPTLHLHDELSPSFQRKTYQICVHQLDLNKFTSYQKKKKKKKTLFLYSYDGLSRRFHFWARTIV